MIRKHKLQRIICIIVTYVVLSLTLNGQRTQGVSNRITTEVEKTMVLAAEGTLMCITEEVLHDKKVGTDINAIAQHPGKEGETVQTTVRIWMWTLNVLET
jgi:allophanate hydrolase subunit 1